MASRNQEVGKIVTASLRSSPHFVNDELESGSRKKLSLRACEAVPYFVNGKQESGSRKKLSLRACEAVPYFVKGKQEAGRVS